MSENLIPLDELITFEAIPEEFAFFKDGLINILPELFVSDLESGVSLDKEDIYHTMTLVSFTRLAMEVPGTDGLALVLNPAIDESDRTEFPVFVDYSWGILKYVEKFNLKGFDFTPRAFYDILINISDVNDKDMLYSAINMSYEWSFEEDDTDERSPIEKCVDDFNTRYSPATPLVLSSDPDESIVLEDLTLQLVSNGNEFDIIEIIFTDFILSSDSEETISRLEKLFSSFLEDFTFDNIASILIPRISASLESIDLALEFPRPILKPINPDTNEVIEDENIKSKLIFTAGRLSFSSTSGFEFEELSEFTFQKSQIGKTGITLEFDNMKLDLSRTTNIPEAAVDGRPDDFVGVFVEHAAIGLPSNWFPNPDAPASSAEIVGTNLLIGTGGISGTIGLQRDNGTDLFHRKLGGLEIGLEAFDITFLQNRIISSNIHGNLKVKGFKDALGNDALINIDVHFDEEGDFKITASETDGIPLNIPNVFTYLVKSLSIGKEDGKFFISTSGTIDFDSQGALGKIFKEPLDMESLIIWEDGTIQLKGFDGTYKLKEPKTLKLGPAKITVTAIHFGTHQQDRNGKMRKYWFFGFDGGISINPGGVDARGDGIKLYFTVDNNDDAGRPLHVFFRISSIAIDLIIPGSASKESAALLISGYLSMKEPSPENTDPSAGTEYIGGISFSLPKVKLSGSAAMRLNPSVPAFIIDIGLSLPKAIPLGSTGLGIYGFRGLLGQRYVATKEAAGVPAGGSWYQYYKAKISPDYKEGIQVSKFTQKKGFSIGAGVSLATNFDGGKTFSSKIFFMLSLPDVFLLQGQGNILSQRIDLDTTNDPPFTALIAITSKSVEAAFGVNLKIPKETGNIATVSGLIEMGFFFGNSGAWYVNVGRDNPAEKRVTARILTLFDAYFYFMLSKQGIRTGAGASWGFSKHIGPFGIEAGVYIDVAGKVSFKPVQVGGSIRMGGYVRVFIWRFKLGLSLDASLAAEAPKPFIVTGAVQICIDLPRPLKKLGGCFSVDFTWSFNKDLDLSEIPLLDPSKVRAANIMSEETFPVYAIESIGSSLPAPPSNINSYIIPVDSFIDIEFLKGMGLGSDTSLEKFGPIGMGSSNIELVPPQQGKSPQVQHIFTISKISIHSRRSDSEVWEAYDVFEAMTPLADLDFVDTGVDLRYGYWQMEDPGKYNKLRIFAQSPLSYIGESEVTPEEMGFEDGFLFCAGQKRDKQCVVFTNAPYRFSQDRKIMLKGVLFRVTDDNGYVYNFSNSFGLSKALTTKGKIEIFFLTSAAQVDLRLGTFAEEVRVTYYKKELLETRGYSRLPLYEFVQIAQDTYAPSALSSVIDYTDINNPVDKIVIESMGECSEEGFLLLENGGYLLKEDKGNLVLEEGNSFQCQTQLFEVCWMTVLDFSYNLTIPGQEAVTASGEAMKNGFEKCLQPIWRPDTVFLVHIETSDQLNQGGSPNYVRYFNLIFKTVGPLGHFHKYKIDNVSQVRADYQALATLDREDQFKLASLKNYIDMSRSYPNADGRLINAKPMFYNAPKLLMFYKFGYVYTMFNDFLEYNGRLAVTSRMNVLIKDPSEPVSADTEDPTEVLPGENSWLQDEDPIIPGEVKIINNLADNGANCSGFQAMIPLSVKQEVIPSTPSTNLKPDKLYTAVFDAVYKGAGDTVEDTLQIHSYVFKTSIYGDFAEQVNSCSLRNEDDEEIKKAIFNIEKAIDSSDISDAAALFNDTAPADDPKIGDYADRFDRLMDGILKLGAIDPAVTTDFNIIIDTNTDRIIGILIRNPEPFNDPKIPLGEIVDSIQLSYTNEEVTTTDYPVVYSKDRSKAFISNTDLNILPGGDLSFTFTYKQYNGTEYVPMDSVEVEFELV